ncbi:MAG: DNA repair protein RecO [Flavobacteriia bacterium]|nr:DNA repair protein RecO [Flavobacteriia bacterium]
MKQTDKAILLNRISYSESSFIVTYYTFENGVQKFIFQGAKKKKVPLYPLLISEITYYKRPDSELGKLTSAESTNTLTTLSFNPIKSTISFFIADVLIKCLKSEEKDEELFQFLEQFILTFNTTEELSHIPVFFMTEFSKHLGISPIIHDPNTNYFNIFDGEITAIKPIGDVYYKQEIATLIANYLNYKFDHETFTKTIRKEALRTMIHYYQVHIPRFNDLVSLPIIEDILYN